MEQEDTSDPENQYFPRVPAPKDYYSRADSKTRELMKLIEQFGSQARSNLSSFQSPSRSQSTRISEYQDMSAFQDDSEDTAIQEEKYNLEDHYTSRKTYEYLGKPVDKFWEEKEWYDNLNYSIDLLIEKLGSPILRELNKLWYSGFEDRELKILEKSILSIRKVIDDLKREEKELKLWRTQHRHLKDLLCEVDDILDDMALRAPQLKVLFRPHQVSQHPYLTDKLAQMNNLIQELGTIAVEIKSVALPEFNARRRKPPGPTIYSNQSIAMSSHAPTGDITGKKKNDSTATLAVNENFLTSYAFIRPQEAIIARAKEEPDQSYDFISASKGKSVRTKNSDTGMKKQEDSAIYDEEPSKNTDVMGHSSNFARASKEENLTRKRHDAERIDNQEDMEVYHEKPPPPPTASAGFSTAMAITSIENLPKHLQKCLLYTSLFPRNYEFKKDMLVQMWIAVGYIRSDGNKLLEDTASDYFDKLLLMSLFQVSTRDESSYLLQDDVYKLVQEGAAGEFARLEDGNINVISKGTLHSSVLDESTTDPMIFKSFHKLKGLQSLLLLHETKKHIKQIPYDLILNLRCIRVLDLSGTQVKELPSSVGDMKALQYLDLSRTRIKSLPQSLCSLSGLQILKLRDCFDFVELPKNMKNIVSLRHLELDITRQLTVMPPRMGRLTNLQTLSAFIAGKARGSRIAELKEMNNLRGSLRIVKLENVPSVEDAEEAAVFDKEYLRRLELQWSMTCIEEEKILEAEDVLEGLQPPKNLKELEIVCYGGRKFPTWTGDSSYSKLAIVCIYNCRNCTILPLLGRLPSLKTLFIGEMHALENVDEQFFGSSSTKGFSKLETLVFDGMPSLEEWTGIEENGMPCLRKLTIVDCPNLVNVPELSNLKSLQHLQISLCFKLRLLAEERLPASLQTLIITDCPKLKEGYQKEGVDWHKIKDVPTIWIDYQQISNQEHHPNEPA